MAGQGLIDFLVERAIQVMPVETWGLAILGVFIAFMLINRFSRGASIHIGFILVLALATLLGAVFNDFLRPVLYALAMAGLLYGGWKYFSR